MSEVKYIRDMYSRIGAELDRSKERSRPVMPSDYRDPVNSLAKLVFSYEPRDLRLGYDYMASHTVLDTSSEWAKDVAEGARLREISRTPGEGRLLVAVDAHSNMAEFERYNSVVRDHNERWEAEGCPEDAFDPWNGDVLPVEGYVDKAMADEDMPRIGEGGGRLDRARPSTRRSHLLTVEYRVIARGGKWTLGFVAEDAKGREVCWGEFSGTDLSALVRRSSQMLFGNHEVRGNEGPLSEGLALLVQGRKVAVCRNISRHPTWSTGRAKNINPELLAAKVEEGTLYTAHGTLGYILPIVCLVAMVIWPLIYIGQHPKFSGNPDGLSGFWAFAIPEIFLVGVSWVSNAVATAAKRRAEASRMRQSFL